VAVSEQIKIFCVKLGISVSELARLYGSSPQAFSQKMKRERFTTDELKKIANLKALLFFQMATKSQINRYNQNQQQGAPCLYECIFLILNFS